MSELVTVFGGSGFVGRYIVRQIAAQGWKVRVAVRDPKAAAFLTEPKKADQIVAVACNLTNEDAVRAAVADTKAVVNCVGILAETGGNRFGAVQAEGAARIARLGADAGVERFVQISAIGADPNSNSEYSATKGRGEAAVREHMPDAVILRPSIIFGAEDQFFNRFAAMTKLSPFVPVVGASTRFQPVFVEDVVRAAVKGILGQVPGGIYELGGPDKESFATLMQRMLRVIRRNRLVLPLPLPVGQLMGLGFDMLEKASGGALPNQMITRDQVKNLARDNVVTPGAKGFAELGITPVEMDKVLPEYLWAYRPRSRMEESKARAEG